MFMMMLAPLPMRSRCSGNRAGRKTSRCGSSIGTDFEVRVWETLLRIPMGQATTYSDIANHIGNPKACRAVGAAVGKNPISFSFVAPCHRVLGRSGALTWYHWGIPRKQAMLGREAGHGAEVS